MPISETKVKTLTALKRVDATKQLKFDAAEVADIIGIDKHTVLFHLRTKGLEAKKDTTKSGRKGSVVTKSALKTFLKARLTEKETAALSKVNAVAKTAGKKVTEAVKALPEGTAATISVDVETADPTRPEEPPATDTAVN